MRLPCYLPDRVNCCWPSPAQSILVPSPAGFMTMFHSLTTLWVVQLSFCLRPPFNIFVFCAVRVVKRKLMRSPCCLCLFLYPLNFFVFYEARVVSKGSRRSCNIISSTLRSFKKAPHLQQNLHRKTSTINVTALVKWCSLYELHTQYNNHDAFKNYKLKSQSIYSCKDRKRPIKICHLVT
jgi:hypothetical protein